MVAWLRRIIVSFGVGGTSYVLMLAFMVASVVYDRELEPVVTFAFETGRQIIDLLETWVSGTYWGQVAVNHLREMGEHDPCRAFDSGHHHCRHFGRHATKSGAGWHSFVATPCHCDCQHTRHARACGDALHLQRACPGNLCSVITVRGLDLAGIVKHAERLGRYDSGSAQIDQRRATRFLRPPLRYHGTVQYGRCLFGQRPFCVGQNQIRKVRARVPFLAKR